MSAPQPTTVTADKPEGHVHKLLRKVGTSFATAMSADVIISESNVTKLVDMGFNERAARAQLTWCHDDVHHAAEYLVHSAHFDHPEAAHSLEEYEAHPECPICHREVERQHHKIEGFLHRVRSHSDEPHEPKASVNKMLKRQSIGARLARMTSRDALPPMQPMA